MKKYGWFLLFLISCTTAVRAQAYPVDSIRFFTEEGMIQMTLTTDLRQLQTKKSQGSFQPARVTMKFPDSTEITEPILAAARGSFRREYCRIPPMMLNFRSPGSSRLHPLGKLKLVLGCDVRESDEELVLKEFLVYKIYNLLEDRSFRVRLLRTTYHDTRNRIKSFSQYAFLIEDDADMARRNGCEKRAAVKLLTEATNRDMMTLVALFQYMIGNTDWTVPNNHNIKLIYDRNNKSMAPYVVPYDFDYCGLVDASYAVPNEVIGTDKVTERVYRGFPRTVEEIQLVLDVFRGKKENIYALINQFELLDKKIKKGMISYLEDFFKLIEDKASVKSIFVDNARIQ
ncbi:MAG: hypothetical protein HYZ15_07625 [Sphingobacteriales bacterium]|nr:hypothetical protein [Sphingobacteriales bacterium]